MMIDFPSMTPEEKQTDQQRKLAPRIFDIQCNLARASGSKIRRMPTWAEAMEVARSIPLMTRDGDGRFGRRGRYTTRI